MPSCNAALLDVAIRHGKVAGDGERIVLVGGELTLIDISVRDNISTTHETGGIISDGTLTIINSTVSRNETEALSNRWCRIPDVSLNTTRL